MKKFVIVSIVFITSLKMHAQCDKAVTWTSSKTEYLDSNGVVQKMENVPVDVQTTPRHLTVTFKTADGQTDTMEGDIENMDCNWKEAYKDGVVRFKAFLAESSGDTHKVNIIIEAKAGKITITLVPEHKNGLRIRILVDKYAINT